MTRPSPGTWKPASRSSVLAHGKRSDISVGPISSTSSPRWRWKAATRRYSWSRSASAAASISPTGLNPVDTPGLGLEPGVEVAGVQPDAGADVSEVEPKQVISPAACHVVPLVSRSRSSSDDVGPAFVGEVVGDRAADHAATDDDDPGPVGQLGESHRPT